jgi:glycogen synthase
MRILMTTDAVGGVWTYSLELARALRPHGVEVQLASMGPPPDQAQLQAADAAGVGGVNVSSFALEWQPDPWDDVERAGEWLLEVERRLRPDLVHLNGYAHGCLPWEAPVISVAHSDVLSWWEAVRGEPAPPRYDRYRTALYDGLGGVAAVCAPTVSTLEELRRHVSFAAPGFVVHNGRSVTVGPATKHPFVLGAGRYWDEAKNLAALERVSGSIAWPVVVAGEGTPAGRRSSTEIAALMARASIFASPVRYEPFGLAILEAALAGCVLVLGNVASLEELWEDAAVFVDPEDDDELAFVLDLLAERPERRFTLARRARRRARCYTPKAMASGYLCVYAEALHAAHRVVAA